MTAPTTTKSMPNKWRGTCTDCGQKVEPLAGLVRKVGDKWLTYHESGQCPNWTATPAPR